MDIEPLMLGAIMMAAFTASLFFLRFWKTTRDRFFLFFSISFGLEGFGRLLMGLYDFSEETVPLIYLIRLVSYLLILFAIVDKNRASKKVSPEI